jgi:hypothetical protein
MARAPRAQSARDTSSRRSGGGSAPTRFSTGAVPGDRREEGHLEALVAKRANGRRSTFFDSGAASPLSPLLLATHDDDAVIETTGRRRAHLFFSWRCVRPGKSDIIIVKSVPHWRRSAVHGGYF